MTGTVGISHVVMTFLQADMCKSVGVYDDTRVTTFFCGMMVGLCLGVGGRLCCSFLSIFGVLFGLDLSPSFVRRQVLSIAYFS